MQFLMRKNTDNKNLLPRNKPEENDDENSDKNRATRTSMAVHHFSTEKYTFLCANEYDNKIEKKKLYDMNGKCGRKMFHLI